MISYSSSVLLTLIFFLDASLLTTRQLFRIFKAVQIQLPFFSYVKKLNYFKLFSA